jgi:transposase-like protein
VEQEEAKEAPGPQGAPPQVRLRQEEALHLEMVEWIMDVVKMEASGAKKHDRGFDRQRERRQLESELRRRAVELTTRMESQGDSLRQVAMELGLTGGTLSTWHRLWRTKELEAKPLGRPARRAEEETKKQVSEAIQEHGLMTGLPRLMEIFPEVARGELAYLLHQHRVEFINGRAVIVHALRWTQPGSVWAMDFTAPPKPIDGMFHCIFAVRDLGSGKTLVWLPLKDKMGKRVRDTLAMLFDLHGAPLVVKSDNDKAFLIAQVRDLFHEWGVIHLLSPRYCPRYNGSCEAGIGTLKTYAHYEAARHDRPWEWTCDDVETARLRANECARPLGRRGPTADQAWNARTRITNRERDEFIRCVKNEIRNHDGEQLDGDQHAGAIRKSISEALVAYNYLEIRSRRFCPPFKSKFWSNIS